jgi:hypothetical protein
MFEQLKPLLDSNLITEETRKELSEAWEAKLNEAREQVRAELREEFAQRYEHDKTVMVEALDRMVTDGLTAEIQAQVEEKNRLSEDRVRFQTRMKESATRFNQFMVTKLAEEISELRRDRRTHNEGLVKLENFIVGALAREIQEFAQDKRDVVETKVRLVREARGKLESLKARFVKESAAKMSQAVSRHLRTELTQLQEDIKMARENNFGRRIFEAYAAEFGATHLNEKAEVRRLQQLVSDKDSKLAEAIELSERARVLVENKNRELRMIRENNERTQIMTELLNPLNQDKAEVMRGLLESVQTARLKSAFEKYLPAVLEDRKNTTRKVVAESVTAVTGDKQTMPVQPEPETQNNVIELKRLAGL